MNKNLLLIMMLVLTFSCSSFKKIVEPPKVKLDNVNIVKMAMTGVDLEIVLGVQNPNNIDLDVKNLTYTLAVKDKEITSGKLKEKVVVKGKQKTVVSLPLTIKYSDLLSSAVMFLKQEGMPYRVKGSVEIGPFTIPFDDNGNLKAADL
ncbi:MAG: LEA type 2 family protein [Bacteriovorax sp.]|nr:LEA type 2 family protein [Bacteriovorax sp.]